MKTTESTLSELAFLFKLLPLLHEVDTVDRLHRLLLALVTSGTAVGYRKAMLFVPDESDRVIRGRYGVAKREVAGRGARKSGNGGGGFDDMARCVFESIESVEAGDLTVAVRSYSVPLSWYRSGLVKAARTTYPVLVERGSSEFATDTFFEYFGVTSYIALPIELDGRVTAVLAVDRSGRGDRSSTDEISILYSLVQHTAAAAGRLLERALQRRRARILSKLHASLHGTRTRSELEESLKAGLAMVCRGVGGSVCLLRDDDSRKTIPVDLSSRGLADAELAVIDGVLELTAGTLEPLAGTGAHPRLRDDVEKRISYFFACPLLAGRDCFGALAVFAENGDAQARTDDFTTADRMFLELCAGVIAAAIAKKQGAERIRRLEDLIQELSVNLVRERQRSRIGDRSVEWHIRVGDELRRLRRILAGRDPARRLSEIAKIAETMERHHGEYWDDVLNSDTDFAMTDLFGLVRDVAEKWRTAAERKGVAVTLRIPDEGPSLLLDREDVRDAVEKVLAATLTCLNEEDKVLVECSTADGRALICVADTGRGLPGDAMSRLFMPFTDVAELDQGMRALSLAGKILQKHGAEIMIKSSPSWRTILVLSFPKAAGRDRRKRPSDRRRRRERRVVRAVKG
jgi:signal transduction histidine kinase